MRRILIPHYSKNSAAQYYLFENNINIDNVANSFIYNILSYKNEKKDSSALFLTNNLLSLSGYLNLDTSYLSKNQELFTKNVMPKDCDSLIAGIWFSNRLMASYFNLYGSVNTILHDLNEYTNKQYSQLAQDDQDKFELGLAFGLMLSKNYHLLLMRPTEKYFASKTLTPNQKALITFRLFGITQSGQEVEPIFLKQIDGFVNDFPEGYNFHPQIIAHLVLFIGSLYQSDIEKAKNSFQRALEISKLADYKLYEVKLLKNLSFLLRKIGEDKKAQECEDLAISLLNNPVIDYHNL